MINVFDEFEQHMKMQNANFRTVLCSSSGESEREQIGREEGEKRKRSQKMQEKETEQKDYSGWPIGPIKGSLVIEGDCESVEIDARLGAAVVAAAAAAAFR